MLEPNRKHHKDLGRRLGQAEAAGIIACQVLVMSKLALEVEVLKESGVALGPLLEREEPPDPIARDLAPLCWPLVKCRRHTFLDDRLVLRQWDAVEAVEERVPSADEEGEEALASEAELEI